MLSNRSAPGIWLISVAALAAVLVIVSVLLNVLLDDGPDDRLPENTPEGTVQRYLLAISDDEPEDAFDFLAESLQESCGLQHFIQTTSYRRDREFSARLTGTVDLDGAKLVSVEITEPDDVGPFNGGGYSFETSFTLVEEDGEWRISESPWPAGCVPPREPVTPEPTPRTARYGRPADTTSKGRS